MGYKVLPIAGDIVGGTYGHVDSVDPLGARFSNPLDTEFSPDGSKMYIADFGNSCVRVMTMSGTFPVSTFVHLNPRQPYSIDVHPTSGNLYITAYLGGYFGELLRVTPAGAVTILKTAVGYNFDRVVVDTDETYVYVKEHVGEFSSGWRLYDLATMTLQTETPFNNDGAYPGMSGLMRTIEPNVYLGWYDYIYPYNTGAFLRRSNYHAGGSRHSSVTFPELWPDMFSYSTRRLTPAPSWWTEGTGREAVVALSNYQVLRYDYDPDPDGFWLDSYGHLLPTGIFPYVPSELLCCHAKTAQLFAATTRPWSLVGSVSTPPTVSQNGSGYGVPYNCIVTYAPNDTVHPSIF